MDNNANGTVKAWMDDVLSNFGKNAAVTIKCCTDLINFGVEKDQPELCGFGFFYKAQTYYMLNEIGEFYEQIKLALIWLERAKNWQLMAKSYNLLGICALNRGNAPVALDYYMVGIRYANLYNLRDEKVLLYINMGALYAGCKRYEEAIGYLEKASEITNASITQTKQLIDLAIAENTIKSFIGLGKIEVVQEILESFIDLPFGLINQNPETRTNTRSNTGTNTRSNTNPNSISSNDHLTIWCMAAIFYNEISEFSIRDYCISTIAGAIEKNMPVLDMFDDFYDYGKMLLEIGHYADFWQVIDILDPLSKSSNLINLQLKLLSLKLKYYRATNKSSDYLKAAGLYYELSELKEQETNLILDNVISIRKRLENTNNILEETKQANQILTEKSEHDPLTGLANRGRLRDFSKEIYESSLLKNSSICVEILDVDYFKEYNDNYGHQLGDECLVSVSDAIKSVANAHNAFAARYGGDEFVVIYTDLTLEDARIFAAELKAKVEGLNREHKFSKACSHVTISQGLCWGKADSAHTMMEFLHEADENLYRIKKKNRNDFFVGAIK